MEKICLDTGILTEYLLNKKEIMAKIIQLEQTADLAVTPQIIFELFCFAEASEKPEENKQVIRDLVLRLTTIDWTAEIAEEAAKKFTELSKESKNVNLREVFLGVLALKNKYQVYTDNPEAYEGIGVKLYK